MTNIPGGADAAAAIHAAFAVPVAYTGAGVSGESLDAVRSDRAADAFTGPGSTLRETSFEIRIADLPESPRKGDRIVDGEDASWAVIDITRRDDIDAWVLIVERSA
jgi:hypothetical protein